jgi:hypothetical protein
MAGISGRARRKEAMEESGTSRVSTIKLLDCLCIQTGREILKEMLEVHFPYIGWKPQYQEKSWGGTRPEAARRGVCYYLAGGLVVNNFYGESMEDIFIQYGMRFILQC